MPGGIKNDAEKPRTDLLPVRPLLKIAKVLTFGAKKYTDRNWEEGFKYGRVYGAALRHLFAWWQGENIDTETGLSHLAHAACCILFLLEFEESGAGIDDRPSAVGAARVGELAAQTALQFGTQCIGQTV